MHRRISGVCTSVRRRPRRARVEGKRSRVEGGAVVGREPAGRRGKERSGELERREPSNLVPSRLEVCKNKREERSACPAAPPPPPPAAADRRSLAISRGGPQKLPPFAPRRDFIGRRGWPRARDFAILLADTPLEASNRNPNLVSC